MKRVTGGSEEEPANNRDARRRDEIKSAGGAGTSNPRIATFNPASRASRSVRSIRSLGGDAEELIDLATTLGLGKHRSRLIALTTDRNIRHSIYP